MHRELHAVSVACVAVVIERPDPYRYLAGGECPFEHHGVRTVPRDGVVKKRVAAPVDVPGLDCSLATADGRVVPDDRD